MISALELENVPGIKPSGICNAESLLYCIKQLVNISLLKSQIIWNPFCKQFY